MRNEDQLAQPSVIATRPVVSGRGCSRRTEIRLWIAYGVFHYLVMAGITLDLFWPLMFVKGIWNATGKEAIDYLKTCTLGEAIQSITIFAFITGSLLCSALAGVLSSFQRQGKTRVTHTTANFRDQSPYGDANLADRASIRRALMGHGVPDAPTFDD